MWFEQTRCFITDVLEIIEVLRVRYTLWGPGVAISIKVRRLSIDWNWSDVKLRVNFKPFLSVFNSLIVGLGVNVR